nr:unnamed protein product [Callosobruchus analis]
MILWMNTEQQFALYRFPKEADKYASFFIQNFTAEITLDSAIKIANYIKSTALNSRLFTLLCEDLDSDHKILLFHTEVRWLSKGMFG